jgi:hypothetical protein
MAGKSKFPGWRDGDGQNAPGYQDHDLSKKDYGRNLPHRDKPDAQFGRDRGVVAKGKRGTNDRPRSVVSSDGHPTRRY